MIRHKPKLELFQFFVLPKYPPNISQSDSTISGRPAITHNFELNLAVIQDDSFHLTRNVFSGEKHLSKESLNLDLFNKNLKPTLLLKQTSKTHRYVKPKRLGKLSSATFVQKITFRILSGKGHTKQYYAIYRHTLTRNRGSHTQTAEPFETALK